MSDAWLTGPVTNMAYGWRLERRDGVTIGFTSHDRDIMIDGLSFRASPGMEPTSITETLGLETGGLDVRGVLSADAIREDDLAAGRWDGAWLSIFLFDWSNPEAGKHILAVGELGNVSYSGNAFQVEFLGASVKLERAIAPYTSPTCRARFCDRDCGLNQQRFVKLARISAVSGDQLNVNIPMAVNAYAFGYLRWLDGKNAGILTDIIANSAAQVQIASLPPYAIEQGTRIYLFEGCDKRMATCASRFQNAINFRGEPYLPGNDLLTRYPGAN